MKVTDARDVKIPPDSISKFVWRMPRVDMASGPGLPRPAAICKRVSEAIGVSRKERKRRKELYIRTKGLVGGVGAGRDRRRHLIRFSRPINDVEEQISARDHSQRKDEHDQAERLPQVQLERQPTSPAQVRDVREEACASGHASVIYSGRLACGRRCCPRTVRHDEAGDLLPLRLVVLGAPAIDWKGDTAKMHHLGGGLDEPLREAQTFFAML